MGNLNQKIYTENSIKENELLDENYILKNEIIDLKKLNQQLLEELNDKNKSFNLEISCIKYKNNILKDRLKIYGESVDHL